MLSNARNQTPGSLNAALLLASWLKYMFSAADSFSSNDLIPPPTQRTAPTDMGATLLKEEATRAAARVASMTEETVMHALSNAKAPHQLCERYEEEVRELNTG